MKTYYVGNIPFNGDNSISHYGIPGMRHGYRRYQNPDGSYTAAGRLRYGIGGVTRAAGIAGNYLANKAKSAYANARKGVGKAYSSGKEFITGSNAKAKLQKATKLPTGNNEYGMLEASRRSAYQNKQKYNTLFKEAQKPVGPYDTKAQKEQSNRLDEMRRAKNSVKNETTSMRTLEQRRNSKSMHRTMAIKNAERQYAKTLPGMVENFSKNAEKAFNKSYSEVVEFLDVNSAKAKQYAKKAYDVVTDYGDQAVSKLKDLGSKAYSKVSSFINRLLKLF